jgi:uncharacterized membrane-anchored protein
MNHGKAKASITALVVGLCVFLAIGASSAWAFPVAVVAAVAMFFLVLTA